MTHRLKSFPNDSRTVGDFFTVEEDMNVVMSDFSKANDLIEDLIGDTSIKMVHWIVNWFFTWIKKGTSKIAW